MIDDLTDLTDLKIEYDAVKFWVAVFNLKSPVGS